MWFFGKSGYRSAVLIDCSASRAAGAYAYYPNDGSVVVCYSAEVPVQPRADESLEEALLRALTRVGDLLITEGAPELRRRTGSGRPDRVVVSIAAPWLESSVRTEIITPGKDFTFTRRMLGEVLTAVGAPPEGRTRLPDTVVATRLNGYDTPQPIGMRAHRAEVVILSATVDTSLAEAIRNSVRRLYHTHDVVLTGFAGTAYGALRDRYPHERDFLILDVSPHATDLAFVKHGRLIDVASLPRGIESLLVAVRSAERQTVDEEEGRAPVHQPGYMNHDRNARFAQRAEAARSEWVLSLTKLFTSFAERHALPRTLFLIADPVAQDYVRRTLDTPSLHALWLSDEPLSIVVVTADQLASSVKARGSSAPDVYLSLLAYYERAHG